MKRRSWTSVRNGKDSAGAGQSSSTESAGSATRCGLRSDRPFVPRPCSTPVFHARVPRPCSTPVFHARSRPDRTGFGAPSPCELVHPQKTNPCTGRSAQPNRVEAPDQTLPPDGNEQAQSGRQQPSLYKVDRKCTPRNRPITFGSCGGSSAAGIRCKWVAGYSLLAPLREHGKGHRHGIRLIGGPLPHKQKRGTEPRFSTLVPDAWQLQPVALPARSIQPAMRRAVLF